MKGMYRRTAAQGALRWNVFCGAAVACAKRIIANFLPTFSACQRKGVPRRGPVVRVRIVSLVLCAILGMASNAAHAADPGDVGRVLRGAQGDYAQVLAPREFVFPEDHGPHPRHKQEWWYYTGNLRSDDGGRFGFQLTFFRFALSPDAPQRESNWATSQIYMAHFALTDVSGGKFYRAERFSRAALGLAGARAKPFRVWLEDWFADGAATDIWPTRLHAATDQVALDLTVNPRKPIVLQGERGLSRKGEAADQNSYYYSYTRLAAHGSVRIGDKTYRVEGESWMDREWSTAALSEAQQGWDWFSLQLDDGRELMLYRLRRKDGTIDPASSGTLIERDGSYSHLRRGDFELTPLQTWRSPETGVEYPLRWRLTIPRAALSIEITPLLHAQEMNLSVRYWEGAVKFNGTANSSAVSGAGYLELAGY